MTGIFHILDRFKARKNGSKRGNRGQDGREPSCISTSLFQEESAQIRATLDEHGGPKVQVQSSRVPQKAVIDNSQMILATSLLVKDPQHLVQQKPNSGCSSLDSKMRPRLSFYLTEEPWTIDTPATSRRVALPDSYNDLLQQKNPYPSHVPLRALADGRIPWREDPEKISSSQDFKGMFRASFLKRKPEIPVDNSEESRGVLFEWKGASGPLKDFVEAPASADKGMELAVDLSLLANDQLREDSDGETSFGNESEGSSSSLIYDRDELTSRLTVELKEGPQIYSKNSSRPAVWNPTRSFSLLDPGDHIVESSLRTSPVLDCRESCDVIYSKDWLQEKKKNRMQGFADGEEHPMLSIDAEVLGSRLFVDGRPGPQISSSSLKVGLDVTDSCPVSHLFNDVKHSSYLSVDNSPNVSPRRENSAAVSPCRENMLYVDGEGGQKQQVTSVVARLMGLDNIPSSDMPLSKPLGRSPARDGALSQKEFHSFSLEKLYNRESHDIQHLKQSSKEFKQQKHFPSHLNLRSFSCTPEIQVRNQLSSLAKHQQNHSSLHHQLENGLQTSVSPKRLFMSPKHHHLEGMPHVLKHLVQVHCFSEGMLFGDMDQQLQQLHLMNSVPEQKRLKQILEAIQMKGLLHPTPQVHTIDGKSNYNKPEFGFVKSLFQDPQEFPSLIPATSIREQHMDLEYHGLSNIKYVPETKVPDECSAELGDNTSFCESDVVLSISGEALAAEASAAMMKPSTSKATPKQLCTKPSPHFSQGKHLGSMSTQGSTMARKLTVSMAPRVMTEREDSVHSNYGGIRKSKSLIPCKSSRPQLHKPTKGWSRVEELQTNVRKGIAAPARMTSDGRESYPCNMSGKHTRSVSPTVAKPCPAASKDTSSVKTSTLGSIISGKVQPKLVTNREEPKGTLLTRRSQSLRELSKEQSSADLVTRRILTHCRSDSKLVSKSAEKNVAHEPLSKAQDGKNLAEIALRRTKRVTGRMVRGSFHKCNFSQCAYVESGVTTKQLLLKHQLVTRESLLDVVTESPDQMLERPQVAELVVVNSPPLPIPDADEVKATSMVQEKPLDGHEDLMNGHVMYPDGVIRCEISCIHQAEGMGGSTQVTLAAGNNSTNSLEMSPPWEASMKKPDDDKQQGESGRISEGGEQPSPVSVLDDLHFLEEYEPSPEAKSLSLPGEYHATAMDMPLDSLASGNSQRACASMIKNQKGAGKILDSPLKDLLPAFTYALDLDDQESNLNKQMLKIQVPYISDLATAIPRWPSVHPLRTKDDEKAYVRHIMVLSGVTEELISPVQSDSRQMISDIYFDQTEEQLELQESAREQNTYLTGEQRTVYQKQALDRRVLFDSINEVLLGKFHPFLNPRTLGSQCLQTEPTGLQLVQEVWEELQEKHFSQPDDDSLYSILQKDFAHKSEKWVDFSTEIWELGLDLDDMIFVEVMEAAVHDFMDLSTDKPLPSPSMNVLIS